MGLWPTHKLKSLVGRAAAPADFSGTGFQPVLPHRQDAGATKNFARQELPSWEKAPLAKELLRGGRGSALTIILINLIF